MDAWTVEAAGTANGLPATSMWAVLLGIAFGVLALLGLFAFFQSREPPQRADYPALQAEADELYRHAVDTAKKMVRARSIAAQARAKLVSAEQNADYARQAHDAAQAVLAQVRRVADEVRATRESWPPHPIAYAGQERDISRAALDAYRRGDISVEELREVFRRAGGWDPVLEQHDQEVEQAAMAERQARRAYTDAIAVARVTGQEARIAEVALEAITDEAAEAAAEATEAAEVAAAYAPRSRRGRTPR